MGRVLGELKTLSLSLSKGEGDQNYCGRME
jgi:hypothetical protein